MADFLSKPPLTATDGERSFSLAFRKNFSFRYRPVHLRSLFD